jgi:hypothetical protein
VDAKYDPMNCGACGNVCATTPPSKVGSCLVGRCLIELVSEPGALGAVAVDDTSAYYTNTTSNVIEKVPTAGGGSSKLVDASVPGPLTVDPTSVYYAQDINCSCGSIRKMGLGGQSPLTLVTNAGQVTELKTDPTSVYWITLGGYQISKVGLGGGAPTMLVYVPDFLQHITIDTANLYWTSQMLIGQVPLGADGGSGVMLAMSGGGGVAVTATDVYWSRYKSALWKVPIGGGTAAQVGLWPVEGVLLTGGYVYGFDMYGIERLSIAGGNVEFVGKPAGTWQSLTADATSLYWVQNEPGVGKVMKLTPK